MASTFLGYYMQQQKGAPAIYDVLLDGIAPKRIIELGTGHGGLAVFFGLYAYKADCTFHTFSNDHMLFTQYRGLLDFLEVDVVTCDIFSEHGIKLIVDLIKQPGITLLYCDNGEKKREFPLFGQHLKQGDVILVHDYYYSKDLFREQFTGLGCCEVVWADIQQTCKSQQLEPILEEDLKDYLLYCARKVG
jgi:hypothetical protein